MPIQQPRSLYSTPNLATTMPARSGTSSSSMNTTASFSSSFIESSPSRHSPSRNVLRSPRASIIRDPYDSPSRQIAAEFHLRLSISDRDFNERLDQAAAERARLHDEQLARATEEHQRVLRGAELEIQRLTLEAEQARMRHEEAQQREIERLKREKAQQEADAQRRALEAKQREEEAARQAAEHKRQLQEAEARRAQREQQAAIERQMKEKEEADRKAKEAAEAAEKARTQQTLQPQPQPTQPTQPTPATAPKTATATNAQATSTDLEQIHTKYLALHARMKEFRVAFANQHKQKGDPLKGPVGDTRRNVRLRLGQINTDRKDSVAAIKKLREESFNIALETPGPTVDIRPYLISHEIPPLANEAEAQYPAFLLYMWICFEKFVLKQFEKEAAGADGRTIQEIGLIAASLLADQRYMWKGIPLTDILLAKLHRICPPLFGIRGTMNTAEGRVRLGWLLIDKSSPSEEQYAQRMRGLGAGFAALSLRSFAAKAPAVPMSEYWRAVVSICNTPSEDLWPGHFALLYGLIRDYYKKFLSFYGAQARGVLRRATIDLPARAPPRCTAAAGTLSVLPLGWAKERVSLD